MNCLCPAGKGDQKMAVIKAKEFLRIVERCVVLFTISPLLALTLRV